MQKNKSLNLPSCQILSNLKIIDFAEVFAGPFGISLMADLGADVIKVESYPRRSLTRPIKVDARVADGPGPAYEKTAPHTQGNRNKRFIALNLNASDGKKIFKELIEWADILIDGYAAGVKEKLGFSLDEVHKINDKISMISMPAWGVDGPYKGYTALGSQVEASSGHVLARGNKNKSTEDILGTIQTDASVPMEVIFATISCMYRRKETQLGTFIDLSHLEAFSWYLPGMLSDWQWNQRLTKQLGNENESFVPHGCFPTNRIDEWVVLAVENDHQWHELCILFEKKEYSKIGHEWATIQGRISHREKINAWITQETKTRNRDELISLFNNKNVIFAPVMDAPSLLTSEQLNYRNWWQSIDHKYLGNRLMSGFLWHISPDEQQWDRPAGLLGEHNSEILDELGYNDEDIQRLYSNNSIGNEFKE